MPLVTAPTLTAEQTRRLAALQNRGTRYEAIVEAVDGRKVRLGYLGRHSMQGLDAALADRGLAVLAFLGASRAARVRVDKRAKLIELTDNDVVLAHIKFSGRTERDAICAGELEYVTAAAA